MFGLVLADSLRLTVESRHRENYWKGQDCGVLHQICECDDARLLFFARYMV